MQEWVELLTFAGQSADWLIRVFFILLIVWLGRVWYPDWKGHQTKMLQAQSDVGQALNTLTTIFIAYITSSPKEALDLHQLFWRRDVDRAGLERVVELLKKEHGR